MDLFAGAAYAFRGLGWITKPGIRRFVLIPLGINSALFALLIGLGAGQFNRFLEWILPDRLDWLEWILWPLFAAAVLMIAFFAFTLLANLIGAPFNGRLAEAVETRLTGKPKESGASGSLVSDSLASILSELRKFAYFASRSLPLLILFLIPLFNLAAPFLWIGFTAWMLAIEYSDFPMGNHGILFRERRAKLREHRLLAVGFGGAVLVMATIPVVNFISMPAAVAGATIMWVERFSHS